MKQEKNKTIKAKKGKERIKTKINENKQTKGVNYGWRDVT